MYPQPYSIYLRGTIGFRDLSEQIMRYDVWVGTDRYDEGKGRRMKNQTGKSMEIQTETTIHCLYVQMYSHVYK